MFQVQKSVNQYQQLLGLKQQQQSVSTDEEPQTQRITIETKRQIKKIEPKQKNKKQERHSTSQRSQINNDLNLMAKIQENQSQTQKQNPRRKPLRDISNSRKKNSYQSEEGGGLKRQIQHGHHISMADIQNPNTNQKISPRLINTESNQINYKLMEKKNLINYSNFEFNLLKEAILNVLAHIPQSIAQKSSASNNLITQKALVESLEQQIILATEKQKQKIISENSLYREALKLHSKFHKFIQTNSQKNLSLDSQISLLLSFFKINLIDQQVQLTKAMNQRKRYLFSKGFISLLQNMMMQSKAEKLNLDLIKSSKSDVISNDYINQENKFSASNNCIQMHQKPPQGPKRVQNYEKKQQDSPVRDFLYQEELDDNTFQFSVRELQQLPQAESTSRSDITQKYSSYEYKLIFIGLKALQNNAKEQINIKSYGQSQKSDLEEYKKITESVLIAGTHYRTYILQKSWYCLVQATAQSKLTFQEIQNKKVQLLYLKVMAALKQNLFFNLQRETNIIVLNSKRNNYLLSNCFDCIKYQVKQKKLKIHKFIKQRAWIYKQQIFKQSFVSLLQRAQDLNGLCEELLEEKDIQIKKDFFRNWKNSIHIIDRGEVIRYFQKNRKKVLKNLFQFWKNKTIKNSKEKKQIKKFVLNQKKLKKFELFKDWLLLTHQFQLSNNIKSQSLYSKTIRSLLLNVQQTQLFEQKSQAFQEKIQKNSLEQVFNFWINYNQFQKNQIKLVQNFKKKFEFQKLRDIFKLWFNQIDVLRRWNFLNQNTNLWYSRKKKRVVFNALRTEIGLRTRFKKVQKLKTSQLLSSSFVALKENLELKYKFKSVQQIWMASVAKRFLKQWYLSLSRQLRNKLKVQKVLHKKLVYKTFKAIQIHTVNSKFFNQGLQKLLELRAYNLQKRSFVFGLKKWWHFSVIENSLWRAAKISDANRLQQKVMLAFKQTSLKYMQAQVIKSKVSGHLIKHYFYSWLQELSKMQKANKFFSQVQQKLSQKVYNFLVDRTNKKKAKKGLIQYFRRETQQIQIVQIFNAFKFQLEKRNLKKQKYETDQIKNFHSKFIAQSIFNAWICIKENNFEQRQIFDKFQKKLRLQEKMKIFRVFKQSFVLASIRKKVAKKHQNFVLRECFNSLSIWGFYANNERQIALKVAKNMMNQCFQGLKRYSRYKTYFKAKESEIGFQKVKQKQAQIFSFWRKLAQRSIQFQQNYVQIEKIRRSNHFGIWRNILEETKKEKNFVKFHNQSLIKKAFGALKSLDKVELPEDKNNLKILQVQFHDYIKKKRAIRKLKSNITCQQVIKSYKNISNLYNFQRIFKAWFQAIKHSRRKTVLSKSAFDLRQTVLLEKCLNRLKLYAKKRARARILIDQFQQTSEMITKNNVLLALQNHVIFVKERAQFFYQLINLSASVRTEQAFSQWIQFTIEKRLDQRADAFFQMRKSQYLQRTAFDSLKIHYLSKDVRKYKFSAIYKWDNQRVIKKAFYALKRITHSANRLNFCQSLIGQKKDLNFLSFCFKAFVNGVLILKISKKMKEKAQSFHQHNSKKRVFVAFAMTQNSFKVKSLLEEKREKRIRRTCLLAWQKTYIQKKKMDRMIQIFEDESCCKLTTSFFPRLIKKTYISQIFEHLKDKRQTNIQIAFINEIRKSIFLKKVLKLYVQRKQQILIKSVFLGLRASALKEVQHKSQLNDLEETFVQKGEQELLQIAFNSLQQNLVKKRYKKVADGCFKIRILRQCLGELQKYYYKMQIQKHKTTEIIKMRQARWFQNWITAYFKEKNKNQAQDYLQTTQLLQIMNAWRKLAIKSKKAFFFKDKIIDTSMIRKCFQSWFYFIRKEKELQKIKTCITISREKNTQRNYFIKWLALESDIKLNRKMQIYYKQNFLHKIMKKWQKVKNEKNNRRQNVFKIKQILAARPGLARPLLVLKNKLLFKAFNALVDNTHEEYKEESLEEKAAFAYFFKLERKTFLVLKHHKYENIQEQQADQFHQLFLQKRFLYLLMDGSLILKARRRERQKAMIFRFLSLQKKGLQGLLVNQQKTQEQQIRAYAAYVLCQKRILSLGFCSLKVWAQQRKQYVQNK